MIRAHRDLEAVALAALEVGRALMECGARARVVDVYVARLVRSLGVEEVHVRSGYASLAVTVRSGPRSISRMIAVSHHGVDASLDHALRQRVKAWVQAPELGPEGVRADLEALRARHRRHPGWLVALAVGLACAAFGELLGADARAAGPIFVAAVIGQTLRRVGARRVANPFVLATVVSFVGALLGTLGAIALGSASLETAAIAPTLLLVPGVPTLNAQSDILEGRPTLGSARTVTVLMTMVFVSVGIWMAAAARSALGM